VELTPELRPLLLFIQRGKDGDTADVAPVSHVEVLVTAQRASPFGNEIKQWQVTEGGTLRGGDRFNIRFKTDADACVYIFMYGSDGKASLLFPTKDWEKQFQVMFGRKAPPQDNYCRAEWEYAAPGPDEEGMERFYRLDRTPGRNVLYICANRSDMRGIDAIRRRLQRAPSHSKRIEVLEKVFA